MKKLIMMLFIPVIFFGIIPDSHATLEVLTDGTKNVVYDDVTGQLWIQDLSLFTFYKYAELPAVVDTLNLDAYPGITTWHIADYGEMVGLWDNGPEDIAAHFLPSFIMTDATPTLYWWQGRYDEVPDNDPNAHFYAYVIGTGETGDPWIFSDLQTNYCNDFLPDRDEGTWWSDTYPVGAWVTATAPVPEPATMLIYRVKVKFKNEPTTDEFEIKGEFTLGEGSDGIDLFNESIEASVDSSNVVIPANTLIEEKPGEYKFKGIIDGIEVDSKIKEIDTDIFEFKVKAKGFDLTGTTNLVNVKLLVGDDIGTADVRLTGELKFDIKHQK